MPDTKKFKTIVEILKKKNVKLVVVSKGRSKREILTFYNLGQKDFGENRVQELLEKRSQLPSDIKWQMIGHLQTNKVKYIAPFINLIQSVDSLKLLQEIDKQAKINKRIIDCLLEIKIANEESKYGLDMEEAREILNLDELKNIRIIGLMGIATNTDDKNQIHAEFRSLANFYNEVKLKILSIGMSADWEIAIEEGANMVRIGKLFFGG